MNKKKRVEIFTRLAEKTPNPTTELIYTSNFELLIAVMLSAQATDTTFQNGKHSKINVEPWRFRDYRRN
jgi:endonuclease III